MKRILALAALFVAATAAHAAPAPFVQTPIESVSSPDNVPYYPLAFLIYMAKGCGLGGFTIGENYAIWLEYGMPTCGS